MMVHLASSLLRCLPVLLGLHDLLGLLLGLMHQLQQQMLGILLALLRGLSSEILRSFNTPGNLLKLSGLELWLLVMGTAMITSVCQLSAVRRDV